MENPGDSPQATRRRVWAFVITGLVVVAIVALWPLKGYRIDERKFIDALASPYVGARHASSKRADGKPVRFSVNSARTAHEARKGFDLGSDADLSGRVVYEIPGSDVIGYSFHDEFFNGFHLIFRRNNVICSVWLDYQYVPEESSEQLAFECMDAILDGLTREIPGVTTFYNPPARQLWIDRVRPFLDKHFPKKPGP